MTLTLEDELAAVAAGSDYRLAMHQYSGRLIVEIIYVPAFRAVDMGGRVPMVTNTGVIAEKWFGSWRRWARARKWVRRTVDAHREMLVAAGVQQVR